MLVTTDVMPDQTVFQLTIAFSALGPRVVDLLFGEAMLQGGLLGALWWKTRPSQRYPQLWLSLALALPVEAELGEAKTRREVDGSPDECA
ncbi:MAG: hypothetical protein JRJ58_21360 [Deltaproteobacteria bacterium]|nr:hypothetical protein [Deltaproteobacteria bacterium]